MRTKHGIHVHGFPNAFIVQPTQGANLISNVPHNLTEAGKTIAAIVRHALDVHAREVEVTQGGGRRVARAAAQRPGHADRLAGLHPGLLQQRRPGSPGSRAKLNVGYPAGPNAYFRYLDAWRGSGRFDGLEFRTA